jgi:hypothetical protein
MQFRNASNALAAILIAAASPIGVTRHAVEGPTHYRPGRVDAAAFGFAPVAGEQLSELWSESVGAGEERVACIGGVSRDGVSLITKLEELHPESADSSNISAASSLDECRPPLWFGTVHTHIARFQGLPYTTFSASDRDVITLWRRRWHMEGVFCVLYSEEMAHCEVGDRTSTDTAYAVVAAAQIAVQRGNMIGATH